MMFFCGNFFRRRWWSFCWSKLFSLLSSSLLRFWFSIPPQLELTLLAFYVLSSTLECILLHWLSWYSKLTQSTTKSFFLIRRILNFVICMCVFFFSATSHQNKECEIYAIYSLPCQLLQRYCMGHLRYSQVRS